MVSSQQPLSPFCSPAKLSVTANQQLSGRAPAVVNVGWSSRAPFPCLRRTSRSRFSSSAKAETLEKVYKIVRLQLELPSDAPLSPGSKFPRHLEDEFAQSITSIQEAADLIEKLMAAESELK